MLTIVQLFLTSLECPTLQRYPTGQCSPVSVLDRQVLFHALHQVPEALGKGFLLREGLAVYQTRSQFTEVLLETERVQVQVPVPNQAGRKQWEARTARGPPGLTDAPGPY